VAALLHSGAIEPTAEIGGTHVAVPLALF